MQSHLDLLAEMAQDGDSALSYLKHVVLIRHDQQPATDAMLSYDEFILKGDDISSAIVDKLESSVDVYDICNFQYTSGTTGAPKATMLTHQ
jgi:long-subunit acyl-CoA synthetase (AMP-forming)